MASLVNNLAKEVFQILKGSGRSLSLFDDAGNKVFEPEQAKSIFAEPDKLMVSFEVDGSNSSLNLYMSETAELEDMKKLINNLRVTATRFNFIFNVRKYGKTLAPKDFAFKAEPMMESMWGSAKTSYQSIGNAKLIVRHSQRIAEEQRGARSRRIHSIFVETESGERFRCPMNSLGGARAYARHLSSGGQPKDNFSNFIFMECEKQGEINRVRRHIRKMEESQELTELAESLRSLVEDSKKKINKSKGNRFYSGIVETIQNAPNRVSPLSKEILEHADHIRGLLGIDANHSLFPVLESVAKSLLETKHMEPINFEEETLSQVYGGDAALLEDLIESLQGEFGFEEGVHYQSISEGVQMLSTDAFNTAQSYASMLEGLTLSEAPQNKFTMYAAQWLSKSLDPEDMPEFNTPDAKKAEIAKRAEALGAGLADLVSGKIKLKLKDKSMPRFADQNAAIAFKLDLALRPGAGIDNDSLWTFFSELNRKISYGEQMDPNERFFAQKLADQVDAAMVQESILPEELALTSWMDSFDPTTQTFNEHEDGTDYDDYGQSVSLSQDNIEQMVMDFDYQGFIEDLTKALDFNSEYAEDRTMAYSYVENAFRRAFADSCGVEIYDLESYDHWVQSAIADGVLPNLNAMGVQLEMEEAFDMSVFEEDMVESNYPDDYNASRDPHAQADDEDEDEKLYMAKEALGEYLEKAFQQLGQELIDAPDDEVDNAIYTAGVAVENAYDDSYFTDDKWVRDALRKEAAEILARMGKTDEAIEERYDQGEVDRMNLKQLAGTIGSFISNGGDNQVDAVFDRMQEYYMDSRSMGPLLHKFEDKIKQEIANRVGMDESADMGDDFIDDVTYEPQGDDAETIARLRKLAGI